jgi:hypothetical protein
VPIGSATIPAGLGPGQSAVYETSVTIPATPIPEVSSTGGTLHIDAVVNPSHTVQESNYRNNEDLGPPYDSAPILIEPQSPPELVATTLAVTPNAMYWGDTITVTAQITNEGAGASPQTRALLSLTPSGLTYGDPTTIGIGSITVPPLSPYQTINLVQNITLPAVEPLAIANYTNFGLTMAQDADYVTNSAYPHGPTQGLGYDQTPITITTNPNSTATAGPLPDLAASTVLVGQHTLFWGSTADVSTAVENVGQGGAGPFLVRFVLTGQAGSITDSIFLGQVAVPSLAPGATQQISETLQIPTRLPNGVALNNVGYGRIAVIADPEDTVNVSIRSNSTAISAPVIVRLPGNATTVPTGLPAGTIPSLSSLARQSHQQSKLQRYQKRVAVLKVKNPRLFSKTLHRRRGPSGLNVGKTSLRVAHELTQLPNQVFNLVKKSV